MIILRTASVLVFLMHEAGRDVGTKAAALLQRLPHPSPLVLPVAAAMGEAPTVYRGRLQQIDNEVTRR
jgi:hypothetical protein